MKKNLIIALIALFAVGYQGWAQGGSNIAYVDVDYILSELPETKQVESDLKVHESMLQNQLQAKMNQYQKLLSEYQTGFETMSDVIRQDKERELTQLQQNIQQFQQDAQVSLQKKSAELLQPIYDKIGKAIQDIATENSYDYILSARIGAIDVILYGKESNDVSDKVLTKLGITASAD